MLTATGLDSALALCVSGAARDEELGYAARSALRDSGYGSIRALECRVEGEVVTVSGVVPSFSLKQLAQAILRKLGGAHRVKNLVGVREAA
jgi:hypothetical protein